MRRLEIMEIQDKAGNGSQHESPPDEFSHTFLAVVAETDRRFVPEEKRQADDHQNVWANQSPIAEAVHDETEKKENDRAAHDLLEQPHFREAFGQTALVG